MSINELPDELRDLVGSAGVTDVTLGTFGPRVLRVNRTGGDWFVKLTTLDRVKAGRALALDDEVERLLWLGEHLPVPTVVAHGENEHLQWLVTTALAGTPATAPDHRGDLDSLIRALGQALRRFHETPSVTDCPFDASTDMLIGRAERRIAAGLVDEAAFDDIHRGVSATDLLGYAKALRPTDPDTSALVVTHGEFDVSNVIIEHGAATGFVDVGRAGIGDPYRDLAAGARSVAYHFGGNAVGPFFDAYGVEWPEPRRTEFFIMLDELL